jgi:hypothetical protein
MVEEFDGIGMPAISPGTQFQLVYDRAGMCWRVCPIIGGNPISASNPVPVEIVDGPRVDEYSAFGEATLGAGASATLVTKTVPSGKIIGITGIIVGGNEAGKFEINVNAGMKTRLRNSGANRSVGGPRFPVAIKAVASEVITVVATNISNKSETFEATLFWVEANV